MKQDNRRERHKSSIKLGPLPETNLSIIRRAYNSAEHTDLVDRLYAALTCGFKLYARSTWHGIKRLVEYHNRVSAKYPAVRFISYAYLPSLILKLVVCLLVILGFLGWSYDWRSHISEPDFVDRVYDGSLFPISSDPFSSLTWK